MKLLKTIETVKKERVETIAIKNEILKLHADNLFEIIDNADVKEVQIRNETDESIELSINSPSLRSILSIPMTELDRILMIMKSEHPEILDVYKNTAGKQTINLKIMKQ